jgi:uncharacterized iron-regulated membrane protein
MDVMLSLHRDLFLGLPGKLFLAVMALLFVPATTETGLPGGTLHRGVRRSTTRAQRPKPAKVWAVS